MHELGRTGVADEPDGVAVAQARARGEARGRRLQMAEEERDSRAVYPPPEACAA